ncbi:hypothetical protein BN2476_650033 [Paraburkholderia piptadeniae]|uniref:DDE domain-containing protein n=1 Tax=Paraburkholderia piptadeniae TaxID=1701573 RepID=A0A1N7SN63_9BURK|nr:hypothetical protein BN2476_650033 [Paraburkholderia piptadeniae]
MCIVGSSSCCRCWKKRFAATGGPVGKSWRVDEIYIKVNGQWKYLYRAIDTPIENRQSKYLSSLVVEQEHRAIKLRDPLRAFRTKSVVVNELTRQPTM